MFFFLESSGIARRLILAASLAVVPFFGFVSAAQAASITDGNSSVTLNPTDPASRYISQWIIDGVDQYGGLSPGGESLEFSTASQSGNQVLNSLAVQSSNFGNGIASVTYAGDGFTVTVKDILSGGNSGSGVSAIAETITVNNTAETPSLTETNSAIGPSPLAFTLIDLVNLNVNGTPSDDTLTLSPAVNPNTADQTDPSGQHINFSMTPTPDSMSTIDAATAADNNSLGPVTGDEEFRMQWNLSIDPGGSAIVSLNETAAGIKGAATVPLPSSALSALTLLAGLGIFSIVRRMLKAAV